MTYDLAIGFQRTAFLAKTEDLLTRCAKVELTEKTARTRAQNSYLHLILGAFAMETGNTLDYVKTEILQGPHQPRSIRDGADGHPARKEGGSPQILPRTDEGADGTFH